MKKKLKKDKIKQKRRKRQKRKNINTTNSNYFAFPPFYNFSSFYNLIPKLNPPIFGPLPS